MAAGTKKILERNVIVRNLSSLEALGGVTGKFRLLLLLKSVDSLVVDICSDKTGTITQGCTIVRQAWLPGIGTCLVEAGSEVYNPNSGSVQFSQRRPQDLEGSDVIQETHDRVSVISGLEQYLNVASLANLATLERIGGTDEKAGEWVAGGAPTEVAIEVFAGRFDWSRSRLTQGPEAT